MDCWKPTTCSMRISSQPASNLLYCSTKGLNTTKPQPGMQAGSYSVTGGRLPGSVTCRVLVHRLFLCPHSFALFPDRGRAKEWGQRNEWLAAGAFVGLQRLHQELTVEVRGEVQSAQTDLDVRRLQLDADGTASEFLGDEAGREGAGEWIQDEVAWIGTGFDDPFEQGDGFLRRMLLVFRHAVADARNLPHVAGHFRRVVNGRNRLAVINQLSRRPLKTLPML